MKGYQHTHSHTHLYCSKTEDTLDSAHEANSRSLLTLASLWVRRSQVASTVALSKAKPPGLATTPGKPTRMAMARTPASRSSVSGCTTSQWMVEVTRPAHTSPRLSNTCKESLVSALL